nr:hypothetical protein Itr_chr13CG13360 [Ipomoea trifida]GMD58837.1 hypothetical protein Iba_chr11fCG9420 [Ipomoea batatas]
MVVVASQRSPWRSRISLCRRAAVSRGLGAHNSAASHFTGKLDGGSPTYGQLYMDHSTPRLFSFLFPIIFH